MKPYPLNICFVVLSFAFFLCQCKPTTPGQPGYSMSIGDKLEISYASASGDKYCLVNQGSLKHIQFVEEKMISKNPSDSALVPAYVFRGLNPGTDTVILRSVPSDAAEYDLDFETEKYVVTVK